MHRFPELLSIALSLLESFIRDNGVVYEIDQR
jgi:hypothetical protein